MLKPKICMVSSHACIRAFKEAYALKKLGYEVHMMARKRSFGAEIYDTYTQYFSAEEGKNLVKFYDRFVDIYHVHNTPDWIVSMVRRVSDKPIVYDVHDLQSLLTNYVPDEQETKAFEDCSACVYPSASIKEAASSIHGDKIGIALAPYVPSDFLCDPIDAYHHCPKTLVYEGGIDSVGAPVKTDDGIIGSYRYYLPIVHAFNKLHYSTFIYAASTVDKTPYVNAGATVYKSMPWDELLKAIRVYELGFVGAVFSTPLMEKSMSNKVFEYISQGVIPVILNSGDAAKMVESYDCGIVLDPKIKIEEQINNGVIKQKRDNLIKIRQQLVMENNINKLEELYGFLA